MRLWYLFWPDPCAVQTINYGQSVLVCFCVSFCQWAVSYLHLVFISSTESRNIFYRFLYQLLLQLSDISWWNPVHDICCLSNMWMLYPLQNFWFVSHSVACFPQTSTFSKRELRRFHVSLVKKLQTFNFPITKRCFRSSIPKKNSKSRGRASHRPYCVSNHVSHVILFSVCWVYDRVCAFQLLYNTHCPWVTAPFKFAPLPARNFPTTIS